MTLSYDVAGDGPVVVLLHSAVCDRRMWDPQWQDLIDAGHRVVRCDFRGFGGTPAADRAYSDDGDVLDLLDHLGVERAALVASSYGGRVALRIAARLPARVTALALLCAGMPGHVPTAELRAFGAREDALLEAGDLDAAVELNVSTWLGPEADEATRAKVRMMQRTAFELQLAAGDTGFEAPDTESGIDPSDFTGPALVVSGGHDLADFRQIAARLAALLPGARALDLPWAGHLPSLERPAEVSALLTGFLRE